MSLSAQYGYVVLWLVYTLFVYQYMAISVSKARKQYKVNYPVLYADKDHPHAKEFNCVQRGHQNSLEFLPFLLVFVLLPGVRYPIVSAIAGVVMTTGRLSYFQGYATGDPNKRLRGGYQYIGLLAQLVTTIAFAVELLRGTSAA